MAQGFAHGDENTPYIFGRKNVNYKGPQKAAQTQQSGFAMGAVNPLGDVSFNYDQIQQTRQRIDAEYTVLRGWGKEPATDEEVDPTYAGAASSIVRSEMDPGYGYSVAGSPVFSQGWSRPENNAYQAQFRDGDDFGVVEVNHTEKYGDIYRKSMSQGDTVHYHNPRSPGISLAYHNGGTYVKVTTNKGDVDLLMDSDGQLKLRNDSPNKTPAEREFEKNQLGTYDFAKKVQWCRDIAVPRASRGYEDRYTGLLSFMNRSRFWGAKF